MLQYYGLPDISEEPVGYEEYAAWATFELSLADLDYEQVLDDFSDSIANPGSEDFKDRDWHTYQIDMELVIEKVTTRLISNFNKFILQVQYPENINDIKLDILLQSHFLSFNYTDTLERFYGINANDICYIHEKSSKDNCKIILGHGTDPSNYVVEDPQPPGGLSEEELMLWREHMADQHDYSSESAKTEILSYYTKAFKNTLAIIDANSTFFKQLGNIEEIYVLGHSISSVDINYFIAIKKHSKPAAIWYVTYYSDYEKEKHLDALTAIGIRQENIKQIRMSDLKIT